MRWWYGYEVDMISLILKASFIVFWFQVACWFTMNRIWLTLSTEGLDFFSLDQFLSCISRHNLSLFYQWVIYTFWIYSHSTCVWLWFLCSVCLFVDVVGVILLWSIFIWIAWILHLNLAWMIVGMHCLMLNSCIILMLCFTC